VRRGTVVRTSGAFVNVQATFTLLCEPDGSAPQATDERIATVVDYWFTSCLQSRINLLLISEDYEGIVAAVIQVRGRILGG